MTINNRNRSSRVRTEPIPDTLEPLDPDDYGQLLDEAMGEVQQIRKGRSTMDNRQDGQDTGSSPKARTPARVTASEKRRHRDAEAAQLRASGLSYDDIADKLKFRDRSGARKAATRALADVVQHSTNEARRLAMQRLDALRVRLVGIATDDGVATRDQVSALRVLLNVEQREAALLGLDLVTAPAVTSTMFDMEIDRLTREIGALDAPRPPDPWERPDWTPADRVADDVHRDGQSAEVVRMPRRGDRR